MSASAPAGADIPGVRNRRERRRATFVFAAALAILAGCGALSIGSLARGEREAQWVARTRESLGQLTRIRALLGDAENGRLSYAMTGDPAEREHAVGARAALLPAVAALRSLSADNPRQLGDLRLLSARIEEWEASLEGSIAEFDRSGFDRSTQAGFTDRLRIAGSTAREILARMEAREEALLAERRGAQSQSASLTGVLVVTGFGFGLVLLAAAGISASRDFSARIEAERIAREKEELFQLLVESVEDYAIFLLDPAGNVVTWPEGAHRLKGYTAEEAIGLSHQAFYTPEDVASGRPARLLATARREGRAEDEGWRVRRDGSRFWADVVITAIRAGGAVVGFAKVTRDITERRDAARRIESMNEDLRRRAAELAAANEELESFAYTVSHDLRAPLRAIDGFGQALLEDSGEALTDSGRRDFERIRAAARRMGELIDALLELSRTARRPIHREAVDLSATALSIVEDLRRTEPARTVDVRIASGLSAEGDGRLLRLLLQNLIGNAWKFTAGRADASITFGAEEDGSYFVADNGAGFDMAYAGQLFIPFHRLHGATEFPGTGIGLATAARIVRRHGGSIRAEGEVGKGATFRFTL